MKTKVVIKSDNDAFFIIREKGSHNHEVIAGDDLLEGDDNVFRDQTIRFTDKKNIISILHKCVE